MLNAKIYNEIARKFQEAVANERFKINEPLSLYTTFKIGGPADFLILPSCMQEVAAQASMKQAIKVLIFMRFNLFSY